MNDHKRVPRLDKREVQRGKHPGDRYARVVHNPDFRRVGPDTYSVTPHASKPHTGRGKFVRGFRRLLIGSPIESAREVHERLTKVKALAIFGSDNISSSAYATEEIMRVLLLGGIGAIGLTTLPLSIAIIVVLAIVVVSYQQTIKAFPHGASSYIVASKELGRLPGLTAAASLLNDYILTVSVSIAAGVAALNSVGLLLFGSNFAYDHRVLLGVGLIAFMAVVNLRGIRESGSIFALPTYVFVFSMLGLLGYGLYQLATGTLATYSPPEEWTRELQAEATGGLSVFLILRAFASGAVGLSGTEAISDGVPAFKQPEWKNARITLLWMAAIFGTLFLGVSFLAGRIGIVPDPHEEETLLSQLARVIAGEGPFFVLVQVATALVLILAANTAFSDFPRLSYFLGRDSFLPHQFSRRGDKLAFSTGIVVLALVAAVLLTVFGGSVTALIPLYTLGVFTAFTLSQSGMVAHWMRERGAGWRWKAAINGVGAAITGIVALVVGVTKFAAGEELFTLFGWRIHAGSWMVMAVVPLLILLLLGINRHYSRASQELTPQTPLDPSKIRHNIIVPVAGLNRVALQSLAYARSISPNVTAIHVVESAEEARQFREEWERSARTYCSLVTIESPYRALVSPLVAYIDAMERADPNDTVTVVIPEFVPRHWWERLLHNQTAFRLKAALFFRPGTVVVNVPYHLHG